MRRYILLMLLSITTGIKAQTFTEVNPTATNFDAVVSGTITWGDYDNDGDLDVLLTGSRNYPNSDAISKIYRNKGDGTFENSGISLPGTYRGAAAWGDYDNDGNLDIVLTGLSNSGGRVARIYRNKGDGTFVDSNIPLVGTLDCAVAWGDYDNDGYLDLLVTGFNASNVPTSWIYRNKRDGTFQNTGIPLTGMRNNTQCIAWADYDNDGDLDFVLSGSSNFNPAVPATKIYRNKGDGTFEDSGIPLTGVMIGSLAWGDYDNDGDQDLIISGMDNTNGEITKIYRNKGDGTFEDHGMLFPEMAYPAVAWGDYDNDGYQDIILTGFDYDVYDYATHIYRNKGDGTFENSGIALPGFTLPSLSWGDADNDGDLDLLVSGGNAAGSQNRVYINNTITPNTKPIAPTGLQAVLSADSKSVTLSWQRSTDAQTSQNGLSYNIYMSEKLSPMANITNGYRKVAATGNAGERTSYTIKGLIPGKKYYWSVQAVDAAFAGSPFAAEQSFTPPAFEEIITPGITLADVQLGDAAWGDYDNDGYLDILITGFATATGTFITKIYHNKGDGTFEDSGIALPGTRESAVAWADYDNDGYLDFILTGINSAFASTSNIYRNKGDGTFEDSGIPLQGIRQGAVAWGDYDNDGDQDLLITGYTVNAVSYFSRIYKNKGNGTFEDSGIPLVAVGTSSATWADYDNDGDLDLMLTGDTGSGAATGKIYRNNGDGTFTDSALPFTASKVASSAWGDYDNDGDLDFVTTGNTGSPIIGLISKIYRNKGDGTFEESGIPLTPVYEGSVAWGDYDNDGYLDLLVTGKEDLGNSQPRSSKIYRNKGDGTFESSGLAFANVARSSVAWGDYNNDGYLDLLLTGANIGTGASITRIYKNILSTPANTKPQTPAGLQVTLSADSKSAILTWQKATDAQTTQPGLNYNVYLSKVPGETNLQSPMANITNGYRRLPETGNTGSVNTDTIKGLELNTTYYWSVQAIDAAFAGSAFAAEQSFKTKDVQTISFTNITATYGDADLTPAATTTSSLPITFSSDNAALATIVNNKIHIAGVGTANITAKQAGNGSFLPATDVIVTITVSKKTLTVAAENKTITYGDALPTLTYTIAGLANGETETVFTTPVSISTIATAGSDADVYDIDAASAVAVNYSFTFIKGALTIQKASPQISFNNLPVKTYGDADFNPGATITSGLPITYISSDANVATIVNGSIHITGAGAATITAQFPGDQNHLPATDVPVSLTLNKKALTVTAASKTITYGDAMPILTYTITGFVSPETEAAFTSPVSITTNANGDAGIFNITAAGAIAANYNFTYLPGTLTIQKASPPISFNNLPVKTYGDADFNPGATITSGLTITYTSSDHSIATIVGGNIHIVGAGTATITAHQAGNINYTVPADAGVTLNVNKIPLTVTAISKTITYGDALPTLTYTITGFVNGETETVFTTPINITTNATSNVGVYNITVAGAAADNYDFIYQPATLTIQPATANISFSTLPVKTYGDADFDPGASIANGLPITYTSANSNVATIVNGNIHIAGAGTTTITAKQGGNNNYNAATDVAVTLTVNKKQLTVTAADKTKVYGEDLPAFTYTVTGFVNGETESVFNTPLIITTTANAASNTGAYPITPANATADNYLFIYTDGVLSIHKASSTISFVPLPTKTYGDGDFNPGASISNGLSITYTSTGVATIVNGLIHITGAGTASITAKQAGDNNYEAAADVTVFLTVNKKLLTIKANDQTKVYGEPNPAFTYTVTGFVPGEEESVFTFPLYISSTGINAGTYPITPSNAAADNYAFNYVTGTLTIQKAAQAITFNGLPAKTYGDGDFNPGAANSANLPVTYTSSNPNVATIVNGNIHITGAGTVTITASQPGNNNYNAGIEVSQQLMIGKAAQTIQFGPMAARTTGEPAFNPGATASSGLPITYQIENLAIATINGNLISPIRSGFTKITAVQPGNNNYESAAAVIQELEIITGSTIKIQDAVTPNGDGINDYLLIEGIRQFPDNQLYISNASGKIVFEAKGYNNTNNVFRGFAGSGSNRLTKGVYYYVLFYKDKKQTGFFVLEY